MVTIKCKRCGVLVEARRLNKKYCDVCKPIIIKENVRNWDVKHGKINNKYKNNVEHRYNKINPKEEYTIIMIDSKGHTQTFKAREQ